MLFVFEIILRICLMPVLVAQGLYLQKKSVRLPEAAGARTGTLGSGPPLSVLIIGDSSAAGVGVETQDQALSGHLTTTLAITHKVTWHLHAKTGITTAGTLESLDTLSDQRFDIAVQALGVNDVTGGKTLKGWLRDQDRLTKALQSRYGIKAIWVTGVPPVGDFPLLPNPLRWVLGRQATRFDAAQRARCGNDIALHYVPVQSTLDASTMAKDGFHPGPKVYAEWGIGTAGLIQDALSLRKQDNHPVV